MTPRPVSQILLSPDRSEYVYMEKLRGGDGGSGRGPAKEERVARLSHEEPPPELKKKVTLLWYFEGYLTGSSFKSRNDKHPGRVSGECCGPGAEGAPHLAAVEDASNATSVKKWLKTKHAIIFRMSSKVIQVRDVQTIHPGRPYCPNMSTSVQTFPCV